MNTRICLVMFFYSLLFFVNGQNIDVLKREYEYDNAGNRIVRKVVEIPYQGSPQPSEQKPVSHSDTSFNDFYTDKIGDMSLKIFPNPTTSIVTLQIDGTQDEIDGIISLYSLSGAKIATQLATSYTTDIDLSPYPAGIYLATIQINGKTTHWKIIKN